MISFTLNTIKLVRPLNCLITFLSVLIGGFIISESAININLLLIASVSASLITAAGNVINDIYDIELDKISHPKRPLPLNKVSISQAKTIYILLNLLALILLFISSIYLTLIGVLAIALLFIYSSFLKKIFLLSNLVIAFLTGLTFIFAGEAVNNLMSSFIPAGFAFLINLIREIVKDTEDLEGDIQCGINSLPIVLGFKKTSWIVLSLTIILILFTTYPYFNGIYKIEYFVLVMIIVNPILILSAKKFFEKNDKKNIKTASVLLKLDMLIGLVAIYLGK